MKTMMRKTMRRVLCAVLAILASQTLIGQSTLTSVGKPTGSAIFPIEHGFVDLSNGNVHLEIPIEGYKQRGDVSVQAAWIYDSNIWSFSINPTTGKPTTWEPYNVLDFYAHDSYGGWRFNYLPGAAYTITPGGPSFSCTLPNGSNETLSPNGSFTWYDSSGTYHTFVIQTVASTTCTNTGVPTNVSSGATYASDGSGYYGTVSNYTDLNVWAPNGTQVLSTASGSPLAVQVDRNGNCLACNGTGDTLGRSPINATIDPQNANVEYLDVTTTGGGSVRYTITFESINLATSFGVSLGGSQVPEFSGSLQVLENIGLPDGTSYGFTYENGTYGELKGITLPHGGSVGLSYSSSSASGVTMPARWLNQHTGSDGTTNFTLTVQTNAYTNPVTNNECNVYTNAVTNTTTSTIDAGSAVGYKFQNCGEGSYDIEEDYYHDNSSVDNNKSDMSSITTKTYDYTNKCPNLGCTSYYVPGTTSTKEPQLAQWINVTSITQTIWDPCYLWITAGINYQYVGTAGAGLPTYAKQTDFKITSNQWCPNIPPSEGNREVDTAYGYNVNGALFPTSRTFKDSTGNPISQFAYSYDQPNSTTTCKAGEPSHLVTAPSGTPNLTSVSGNRGNLTSITATDPASGANRVTCFYYDTAGAVQATIDPKGYETSFVYDPTDTFPITTTAPSTGSASHVTSKTYDPNTGQVTSYTDQNKQKTTYNYDSLGRLHTVTLSGGASPITLKTITYPSANETDEVDQRSSTTGTLTQTFVDVYGRTTKTVSGGITQDTVYDPHGHKYSVSNPHIVGTPSTTDGTTYWSYDGLGRVTSVTNPAGEKTSYNHWGINLFITDPLGFMTIQTFDSFGDLTSVEEGAKQTSFDESPSGDQWFANTNTAYQYNGFGKVSRIDQYGDGSSADRVRTFTYDGFGEVISQTTPEAGTLQIGYDNNGNVTSRTNQNSGYNSTHYGYDALNRLISKTFWSGSTQLVSPAYSYTYDALDSSGDPYGKGLLTGTSNGSNVQTLLTHDSMGRLVSTSYCLPSEYSQNGCSFQYQVSATHDYAGNMTSLTYPDGRQVTWTYNDQNLPVSETYAQFNSVPVNTLYVSNLSYTPTGQVQQAVFGNDIQEAATYNANQNIATLTYVSGTFPAPIAEKSYTWSNNSANLLSVVNDLADWRTQTFSYDSLNRIGSASDTGAAANACNSILPAIPQASENYTIDAWGNMKESGTWSFQAAIGTNNQIAPGQGYYYDSAGNQTQDALGNTYNYRPDGLMSLSDGVIYTYDANDQRVRKDGTSSNEYIYFGGQLLAMRNAGTGAWTDQIFGPSGSLALVPGTQTGSPIYRINDHLGSLNYTLDANGNILGVASALPYGDLTVNTTGDNFPFTGLEADANGAYHALHRDYAPSQGRWLSADPYNGSYSLADPQTLNRYAYLNNRPMNATDPTGLCDDGDYLCDLGDLFDYLDSGLDSAAASVQSFTGVSIPDEWLPSTQTLLANNSEDAALSEDGSSTITAQGALVGTAMAAGNLPGVGAVFNAGLAGYYAYQGEYGTAAAFGGAAVASMVGLPGGSEIADGVEAVGEAEAVVEPAIEAASTAGPELIGSFDVPQGMTFGTTTFGNYAHEQTATLLENNFPDVADAGGFAFRILPGQTGVDVTVGGDFVNQVGFQFGEIKPLSASGQRSFNRQVGNWNLPGAVQAITYDGLGNVYLGFN